MSNEVDHEYLFRVVHLGDSQEFSEILERSPMLNIDVQNDQGETLLIHCVKRLQTKWTAVFGGDFRTICTALVKRNIDVNLRDACGKSAANYAAELQQLGILRLLIQNGAHLDRAVLDNIVDKEDWILAICASLTNNLETAEHRKQVNLGEKVKLKLFHRLLASSYLSSIRWMCELFPEIIVKKNGDSLAALHIAVIENNVDALKILLEFNANVEDTDGMGHTALHFAVDDGHVECMLSLLKSHAAVNCQDAMGATPLHYIAGSKDDVSCDAMMKHLLEYGANTLLADKRGRLALHWAANEGNANVCAMMVKSGSPVNSRCNDGHAALHIAASQGYVECIRVLVLECGADINIEDRHGFTPLYNAISKSHMHCVELLLYEDASPNHYNAQGISPAHVAASKGLTTALEILVKYKGSLELRNNNGDLPIHEAVLFQQLDAVTYMLRCQCNANVRNNQGLTPLHLAASVGSIHVCQCLLEGDADLNVINTECRNGKYKFVTPLDLAQLNKQSDCAKYLQTKGGLQGENIVKFTCRKIQRWWRNHRAHQKVLDRIEEHLNEDIDHCLEETDETKRVPEAATNCVTEKNTQKPFWQHKTVKDSYENETCTQNIAIELHGSRSTNDREIIRSPRHDRNALKAMSSGKDENYNKITPQTIVTPGRYEGCANNPTGKSTNNQEITTMEDTQHVGKTKTCLILKLEETQDKQTSKLATAKQGRPTVKQTGNERTSSFNSNNQEKDGKERQKMSQLVTDKHKSLPGLENSKHDHKPASVSRKQKEESRRREKWLRSCMNEQQTLLTIEQSESYPNLSSISKKKTKEVKETEKTSKLAASDTQASSLTLEQRKYGESDTKSTTRNQNEDVKTSNPGTDKLVRLHKVEQTDDNIRPSSVSRQQIKKRTGSRKTSKFSIEKQGQLLNAYGFKPNYFLRKQAHDRKSKSTTIEKENTNTPEEDLKPSLEKEIIRKENLIEQITALKQNLEESTQKLEKRLQELDKKLDKL